MGWYSNLSVDLYSIFRNSAILIEYTSPPLGGKRETSFLKTNRTIEITVYQQLNVRKSKHTHTHAHLFSVDHHVPGGNRLFATRMRWTEVSSRLFRFFLRQCVRVTVVIIFEMLGTNRPAGKCLSIDQEKSLVRAVNPCPFSFNHGHCIRWTLQTR